MAYNAPKRLLGAFFYLDREDILKNPIPTDWDGESWCCWAVEWPDSILWEGLLAGLITSPMRGRYWDEKTGNVAAAQEIGKDIWVRNLPLQESLMSCSDATNLSDAIRYLADKLYAKNCCGTIGGPTGIVGLTPGGNISYGDNPGLTQPGTEGDPPEGFSTWEEYFAYKCAAANHLADGIIASLHNLSVISLANLAALATLIGLSLGPFIIFPPSAIPVAIAALVALGVAVGILFDIGDYLSTNREDFVCALYNSESALAAQDALIALIDEALAALVVSSELHPFIRTLALLIASTDTLNQLFDGSLTSAYADADCSGCTPVPCEDFVEPTYPANVVVVTDLGNNQLQIDCTSSLEVGQHRAGFHLGTEYAEACACCHIDSVEIVNGSLGAFGHNRLECGTGQYIGWSGALNAAVGLNVNGYSINSTGGQFTLRVVVTIPHTEA